MFKHALWFVLLACGCGSSADGTQDSGFAGAPEPHLELGQGELEFSSLGDDEALFYAAGAQGGHHVFVSFRARGLKPSRIHVSVTTEVLEHPELVLTREGRVNFARAPDDAAATAEAEDAAPASYDFAGWPAQILLAPCHVGEAARIDVTLTDLDLRSASDTRTIRIAMPDGAAKVDCPPP